MQTLVFNTTEKTVKVYEGHLESSKILFNYENVPTVKCVGGDFQYYEVMQKNDEGKSEPVLRLPISNTNMVITKTSTDYGF
jgi:hypothetical protein